MTNKILLEAGRQRHDAVYDTDSHREYTNPVDIPRIRKPGDTAGARRRRRRASISSPAARASR